MVNYTSRFVSDFINTPYYNSTAVIYDHRAFKRLTTGLVVKGGDSNLSGCEFETR